MMTTQHELARRQVARHPGPRFAGACFAGANAMALLCCAWLAACGDPEVTESDAHDTQSDSNFDSGAPILNACGGTLGLALDGEDAAPGNACGPCGTGVVACSGANNLVCVASTARNACGGCTHLPASPGATCGACELGQLECDGEDALVCVGDRETNACGGCSALAADPGTKCSTDTQAATWACVAAEELRCISEGENACGGGTELDVQPGELCGECARSTWACAGTETVACGDPLAGVNACSGCAELIAEPGDACGDCGGFTECDEGGGLVCNRSRNACNGCALLDGPPGASCGDGLAWGCTVGANVTCREDTLNACGGATELSAEVGAACGACDDGLVTCVGPDATLCIGASALNACGECGPLAGIPGAACAPNALFVCDAGGVVCRSTLGGNLCGGSTPLAGAPGDACGFCDSGLLECAGTSALRCAGAAERSAFEWYADGDGDGFFGDDASPQFLCDDPGEGFARDGGDCDDDDELTYPDADEDECVDAVDRNCDGEVLFVDADNDGVSACFDCDDDDRDAAPGFDEICDGVDNNCNDEVDEGVLRVFYMDADEDDYGDENAPVEACGVPVGAVTNSLDCADDDETIRPGAEERCDGVDNDCDGVIDPDDAIDQPTWFLDLDGDGYGDPDGPSYISCSPPEATGWAANDLDCDDKPDTGAAFNPGIDEICDGIDNNCDRVVDVDAVDRSMRWPDVDHDGYGDRNSATLVCGYAVGFVDNGTDCNDRRDDVHPGARERIADGVDQDCDGLEACFIDGDGDGYIADFMVTVDVPELNCSGPVVCPDDPGRECELSLGLSPSLDCNDREPSISPGAVEEFGDGVDQDCDGTEICVRDLDGDGYAGDSAIVVSADSDCDDPGEARIDAVSGAFDCWDAAFDPSTGEGCVVLDGVRTCPNQVYPNPDAVREYLRPVDGVDADCDGLVRCFADEDLDGYRSLREDYLPASFPLTPTTGCSVAGRATEWIHSEQTYCDGIYEVNPGVSDIVGDGVDNNCDGLEICYEDVDGDRFMPCDFPLTSCPRQYVFCDEYACQTSYDGVIDGLNDVVMSWGPRATDLCSGRSADGGVSGVVSVGESFYSDCDDTRADTNFFAPDPGNLGPPPPSGDTPYDQDCNGKDGGFFDIYVTCGAGNTCSGTLIQDAVNQCADAQRRPEQYRRFPCSVLVEVGVYLFDNRLELYGQENSVVIEGGYSDGFTRRFFGNNAEGWDDTRGFGTVATRRTEFRQTGPTMSVRVSGNGYGHTIRGVYFEGRPGTNGTSTRRSGSPSVALHVKHWSGDSSLTLDRCDLLANRGGTGFSENSTATTYSATNGGGGGAGGTYNSSTVVANPGSLGSTGSGTGGGSAGARGTTGVAYPVCPTECVNAGHGGTGGAGSHGTCGAVPTARDRWPNSTLSWIAVRGVDWSVTTNSGNSGLSGGGGGGGGGGGAMYCNPGTDFSRCPTFADLPGQGTRGGVGASGGNGGGGGAPGIGGGHGGPSIALLVDGERVFSDHLSLRTSAGGNGGRGQNGGAGGQGALPGGINSPTGPGYVTWEPAFGSDLYSYGGNGGFGGGGGNGGAGSGGPGGNGGASIGLILMDGAEQFYFENGGANVVHPASPGAGGAGGGGGSTSNLYCTFQPTQCFTASPHCAGANGPTGLIGERRLGYNFDTLSWF